jgi:hypothetical protein
MTSDSNRDNLYLMMRQLSRLPAASESAKQSLRILDEVNSNFPATRDFLAARGLTLVSQLDEKGREELQAHLIQTLKNLSQGDA